MGVYGTLMTMLGDSASLSGVTLLFGGEFVPSHEYAMPLVVVVPQGGPFIDSPYIKDLDSEVDTLWATTELFEIWMWARDEDNDTGAGNADAVDALRTNVLRAFWSQRANGLFFKPVSGKWQQVEQVIRFGRSYVLTVQCELSFPDVVPVDVTVTEVTIDQATIE